MAKKKRKTKKSTRRRKGLRGLRGVGAGKGIGLLLTNILAANVAHEGIDMLNNLDVMQKAPAGEGETPSRFNFKKLGASGGVMIGAGALNVLTKNDWVKAIGQGIAIGASIHVKEQGIMPALGMGSVDDFLNLYRTDEPLKDLSGLEERLAGMGNDELMRKLA